MKYHFNLPLILLAFFLPVGVAYAAPTVEVVPRDTVDFIPLNPARGDASPQAGVLWGDIRKDVPSGALITFADGFASPPHIHNITYRAVVIEGTVFNGDKDAQNLWMEPGSFWTQPAGEVHITAVGPTGGTAFLEILSGPYLVRPSIEAFDNGERPINIEERNVVWMDSSDVKWIRHGSESVKGAPEIAFLWGKLGKGELHGTFIKLPSNFAGTLSGAGDNLKAVLVKGSLNHSAGDLSPPQILAPGSYVGSEGSVRHTISCKSETACILYVRAIGKYEVSAL
ncbi:MAG: DUF4437 domain-containing protein [Pseudomonadota bacterium]